MDDCIFCKIARGELPSKKIYEDDLVFAFHDISPAAPTHFLVIPKEHIASVSELDEDNSTVTARIFSVTAKLCREMGLSSGYRVVTNTGVDAGQSVPHLHFHVLAGRTLSWPPG